MREREILREREREKGGANGGGGERGRGRGRGSGGGGGGDVVWGDGAPRDGDREREGVSPAARRPHPSPRQPLLLPRLPLHPRPRPCPLGGNCEEPKPFLDSSSLSCPISAALLVLRIIQTYFGKYILDENVENMFCI